jgi:Antitoxin Xre-like helix-turn-helix domain
MTMAETLVPELTSEEARSAVAAALLAAFDRWGVPPDKQAALLGMPDITALRRGGSLPEDADVLARAGHLLAIDRALKRHYGERAVLRDAWLLFPYSELGGQSALALLLAGIDGIKRVRKLIEAKNTDEGTS